MKLKLGSAFCKWFVLFVLINGSSSLTYAQSYFPPLSGNQWDTLSPNRFGYCSDRIDSLYHFLDRTHSKAFILLKDGKIVLEKYFDAFTADSNWYWASAGKTLTASLVGIASDKNLLKLNDPSSKYLGSGWTSLSKIQEDSITIGHQLSMTTGLNDTGNLNCTEPQCLSYRTGVGTRWSYHNAPYTLLDGVIENSTGSKINIFLNQQLTSKTGIAGLYLKIDYNNVFFSKPRAMARFGNLLLNKGNWGGTQVVSENFLQAALSSSQSINPSYGYLTWLNGKSSYMIPQVQISFNGDLFSQAPKDGYAALGKNGQIIFVVPSQNLVWIRMGDNPDSGNPLVSVSYGNDVWNYINKLNCATNLIPSWDNQDAHVYPNPIKTGSFLNFKNPSGYGAELLDISGRCIASSSDSKGIFLSSDLLPGVYFVRFKGSLQSFKLLITN
jgi:CubicO group peptidase (beta-lactamase class C family)